MINFAKLFFLKQLNVKLEKLFF